MPIPSTTENGEELLKIPPVGENTKAKGPKVSRTLLNFWLDATLLVAITFVGWVSVMMQVVFPAPTAAGGWELWGMSFNQWRDAQFISLCVCGLLALEHVVLHWKWVCNVITTQVLRIKDRPHEGSQAIYGVGTFIIILTLMMVGIIAALISVKRPHE